MKWLADNIVGIICVIVIVASVIGGVTEFDPSPVMFGCIAVGIFITIIEDIKHEPY